MKLKMKIMKATTEAQIRKWLKIIVPLVVVLALLGMLAVLVQHVNSPEISSYYKKPLKSFQICRL